MNLDFCVFETKGCGRGFWVLSLEILGVCVFEIKGLGFREIRGRSLES